VVTRGLAESRTAAQKLTLAGQVYIGEGRADKPGMQVAVDAPLHVGKACRLSAEEAASCKPRSMPLR